MPATECAAEKETQHHLGAAHGYGPVQSEEHVIFAVFEETPREGNRLRPTAFPARQLRRDEFSLARLDHLTRRDFEQRVVAPLSEEHGPLVGIARAQVGALRDLHYLFEDKLSRAVCVTDTVTAEDHDSHAALGYSESQEVLSDKQKQKIRATIHADLTDTFGDLVGIADVFDP